MIGRIVRLQVQTDHLKHGTVPGRWYDPTPIRQVGALRLERDGVVGLDDDGTEHIDVHHRLHPKSRNRGDNGISIGFTSHYETMRDRFGERVADGIAGENILVETAGTETVESLGEAIAVRTDAGTLHISGVSVAEPCVEYSRFCLGGAPGEKVPTRDVGEALRFLGKGVRGFYATFDHGHDGLVRRGDLVLAGQQP